MCVQCDISEVVCLGDNVFCRMINEVLNVDVVKYVEC